MILPIETTFRTHHEPRYPLATLAVVNGEYAGFPIAVATQIPMPYWSEYSRDNKQDDRRRRAEIGLTAIIGSQPLRWRYAPDQPVHVVPWLDVVAAAEAEMTKPKEEVFSEQV